MVQRIILSPDNSQVLISAEDNDYTRRIYLKNLQTGKEVNILEYNPYPSANGFVSLANGSFSLDGKYVVFNIDCQLWLAETKSGKRKQLTTEEKYYARPRFSPDNQKILYEVTYLNREVRMLTLDWE